MTINGRAPDNSKFEGAIEAILAERIAPILGIRRKEAWAAEMMPVMWQMLLASPSERNVLDLLDPSREAWSSLRIPVQALLSLVPEDSHQ